jgi:hypothetical protein
MRSIILSALLIASFQFTLAQRIPSSCETPDSIKFWYEKEATHLSILQLGRQGSPFLDSIPFPDSLHQKKFRALIAVYNVDGIPEADTVAHLRPVYDFRAYSIDQFYVRAEEHLFWMQNLKNKQLPCGHPVLDSLLILYNITEYEYDSQSVFGRNLATFRTSTWLNTWALSNELNKQGDIESYPNYIYGDGSRIQDSVFADHIELNYSYGWGDCLSGCTHRRYWKFKVYFDCSVEFVESYGNTLPLGIKKPLNEDWLVFPNPFSSTLEIGNIHEPCAYRIYAVDGRLLKQGSLDGNQITDLDFLPKGLYFLHLRVQDSNRVFIVHKD